MSINNITCEIENHENFAVLFTSLNFNENPKWRTFRLEAGKILHLPHGNYAVKHADNPEYKKPLMLAMRYGDDRKTRCPYDVLKGNNREIHRPLGRMKWQESQEN
jgi:hypothetical protein